MVREKIATRPHHLVMAAFAGGLALATAPPIAPFGVAATVAGLLVAVGGLQRLAALVAVLVLAGAVIGSWRVDAIDRSAEAAGPPGTTVAGRAVLLEPPRRSRFGSSASIRILSGRAAGAKVLARAGSGVRWPAGGEVGSVVAVSGAAVRPRRGKSFDWRAYLRRRGVAYELDVDELRATGERRGGFAGAVDALRRRGEGALAHGLPGDRAALARGMVLGEDERIDDVAREDFQRSGLAHVLAVSGQNVMLLCALALPLVRAAGAGPRTRVAVPLSLIALYVPLAGAGASLQRAGAMGAAGLVAMGAGRAASRWYAVELAAAGTLALNPRVVGDPGWQLSFAAVIGILLLTRPLEHALLALGRDKGRPRRGTRASGGPSRDGPARLARAATRALVAGVAVTLAATVATAPLIGFHFGSVSMAGLGANLVALPVVAPIMWIGMIQVALAAFAPLLPVVAATGALGRLDGVLIGLLQRIARSFAEAPGAAVVLPLRTPVAVVAAYLLIAAGVVVAARASRRNEPRARAMAAAFHLLAPRRRTAILVVSGVSLAGAWAYASSPPPPPDRLTVRFLDVGQGDATLIQDGAGANVLFDGGPPEARVYRLLRGFGVRQVDLMVSTHQSRDHQGGLHEVLERLPVRAMVENGYGTADPDYHRLVAEARARGVPVTTARAGQVYRVGRLTIRVFGPRPRAPGEPAPDEPNPIGVAAIVSEDSFDLWLSADAESDAILQYPLRPVEAMKVSHHGSRDPGLPEVLKRLRPQVAAIEVGKGNSYGHPTPETLKALHAAVPHVYRTDRDGTVTLTVDPDRTEYVDTAR